jgi:hypothetical protein
MSKKRRDFGASAKFSDRDANDGFLECRPYRDANFEINRMEVQTGIQVRYFLLSFRLFPRQLATLLKHPGIDL